MQRATLLISLAIVTTVVMACWPGPRPSPPAQTLIDKTYLSNDAEGAALVPGSRIQLTFDQDEISANGGCNTMGGPYTIAGDRFSAAQLVTTDMGCEAPLMQQDQWLANLLKNAKIGLDANALTLDNGQVRLTLLDREVATPDLPVAGTKWVLDSIVDGPTVSSVPAGVTASVRIVGDRLELNAGCNVGGGSVDVTANTLTFGPLLLTKRPCQAGTASVEQAITATLAGTVEYKINAGLLTIGMGRVNLIFRAGS